MRRVLSGQLSLVTKEEAFIKSYAIDRTKPNAGTYKATPSGRFVAELRGRKKGKPFKRLSRVPIGKEGLFSVLFEDAFDEYFLAILTKAGTAAVYRSAPFGAARVSGFHHELYVIVRPSKPGEGVPVDDLGKIGAAIKKDTRGKILSLAMKYGPDKILVHGKAEPGPGQTEFWFWLNAAPYVGEDLSRVAAYTRSGKVHSHNPNVFAIVLKFFNDLFGENVDEKFGRLIDGKISKLNGRLLSKMLERIAKKQQVSEAKLQSAFSKYATVSVTRIRYPHLGRKPKHWTTYRGTKFQHREMALDIAIAFPRDLARDIR